MTKMCFLFGAILAIFSAVAEGMEFDFRRPQIVPEPEQLEFVSNSVCYFNADTKVKLIGASSEAAAWVRKHCGQWFGFEPQVIVLKGVKAALREREYRIEAKANELTITAGTLQGVRYAMYTLRQVAERESRGKKCRGYWMPEFKVVDSPVLEFRGMHLCYFPEMSVSFIERMIRAAAYYKFNYVVLESWGVFKSERHPELSVPDAPLTPAEARRLATIARDLGVSIIPQVNVLGHAAMARAVSGKHITLDRHPELQPLFEPQGGWNWCLSNPEAMIVLTEFVDEVHDAFGRPSYFHIGCDEADPPSCPKCRAIKPFARLIGEHIRRIRNHFAARGTRVMMWHDMLLKAYDPRFVDFYSNGKEGSEEMLSGLDRDIVICDWFYGNKAHKKYSTMDYFAQQGFEVITCPWTQESGDDAPAMRQGEYAREKGFKGYLQTVWHHYRADYLPNLYEHGANAAWRGGKSPETKWVRVFTDHWRQLGWDMGERSYSEEGLIDSQVTREVLAR